MAKAMLHLNSNILAAVDIETTGPNPDEHEIWQICILPLDSDTKPNKSILPFYLNLKPEHPERAQSKYVSRQKLAEACTRGMEQNRAADFLDEWFQKKLQLPPEKKICALSHDWPFNASFISKWLRAAQFEWTFHAWFRDLIPVSLYLNDSADLNVEQIPYPKSNLGFLCARLNVTNETPHDAMSDCIAIGECYRRILKRLF